MAVFKFFSVFALLVGLAEAQAPASFYTPAISAGAGAAFTALQPDGKILINNATQRLNTDGTLDSTYSRVGPAAGQTDSSVVVNSQGQIFLVRQTASLGPTTLLQFNSDGSAGPIQIALNSDEPSNLLVQADDKILVWSPLSNAVGRFNRDGTPDSTFSVGFGAETVLNSSSSGGQIRSIALQADGKILAAGLFVGFDNNPAPAGLVRLNANGTVDHTFAAANPPSGSSPVAVTVRPDGKIVAYFSQSGLVLFNPDGSVSATPGLFTTGSQEIDVLTAQSGNKVVVGGIFTTAAGQLVDNLIRINADGSVDSAFQPGPAMANLQSRAVKQVVVEADGRIYGDWGLVRLSADGSVDSSFIPVVPPAAGNVLTAVKASDGRTFFAGTFLSVDGLARVGIAAVLSDGTLDSRFAAAPGILWNQSNYTSGTMAAHVAVAADGSVLLVGTFSAVGSAVRNGFARFLPDGSLDPAFNPVLSPGGTISVCGILSDGRILIGGSFATVNGQTRGNFAAFSAQGVLDPVIGVGDGSNGPISAFAVRDTGGFYLSGMFSILGSIRASGIGSIQSDGTVDAAFTGTPAGREHFVFDAFGLAADSSQ